jgi:hypothetical protein
MDQFDQNDVEQPDEQDDDVEQADEPAGEAHGRTGTCSLLRLEGFHLPTQAVCCDLTA